MDRPLDLDDLDPHRSDLLAPADTAVVGAGLAGLTAALVLARRGHRVVLLDGSPPGGRARTDDVGGFRFNRGPHALYDAGEARRVLRDLGVRPGGAAPPVGASHVRLGDDVAALPVTPSQMLGSRLLSFAQKARLVRFLRDLDGARPGMSAADWLRSNGLRGRAHDMAAWLIRLSTYCEQLDRLSADAAAAQLAIALRGVTYLHGGWQSLVDALADLCRRSGVELLERAGVQALRDTPGGWSVDTARGALRCRAVVLAAGGPGEASRLLRPAGAEVEGLLGVGEPLTAAVLDLGLVRPSARVPLLFSFDEPLYLSQHWPPAHLGPPGSAVVHVLRYGARSAEVDRRDLVAHAAAAGIVDGDVAAQRFLARMTVAHAVPAPHGGGLAGRAPVVVPGVDGVFLAGDWVGARGQLADASVASAEEAAGAVDRFLAGSAVGSSGMAGSRR
jgi:phytoene dehydrogenase-like protein